MSKGILYYDDTCPVCKMFKASVYGYVGDAIEYKPIEKNAKTFRYVSSDGSVYLGKDALRKLLSDYPNIAPTLNLLPEQWKIKVVNAGVHAASMIRSITKNAREMLENTKQKSSNGGCGCNNK